AGLDSNARIAISGFAHGVVPENSVVTRSTIEEIVAVLLNDFGVAVHEEIAAVKEIVPFTAEDDITASTAHEKIISVSVQPLNRNTCGWNGRENCAQISSGDRRAVHLLILIANNEIDARMAQDAVASVSADKHIVAAAALNIVISCP